MQVPALIAHTDFYHYSAVILGDEAARLGKMIDGQVPVPPLLCITRETLLEIAQYNKLDALFTTQKNTQQSLQHIQAVFFRQQFPAHISQAIIAWHHRTIKHSYVKVFASHHQGENCFPVRQHVLGDTNTLESILEVWWESIVTGLKNTAGYTPLQLATSAICVQKESTIVASGVALSIDPLTGFKNTIHVDAVHGVYQNHLRNQADSFTVSLNDFSITSFQTGQQRELWLQAPDELHSTTLNLTQQNTPALSQKQLVTIAQLTNHIKKKFIHHVAVSFVDTGNSIEITNVEPFYFDHLQAQAATTTVAITLGNPEKFDELVLTSPQSIFFKSDYLFLSTGVHPMHLVRSKEKNRFIALMVDKLSQLRKKAPHFSYRPLSLDASVLRKLRHAELYELNQTNPFLGNKGALLLKTMPEVFELELEIIMLLQQHSSLPFTLVLPYSRSVGETKLAIQMIKAHGLLDIPNVSLQLPLSTPSQALDAASYQIPEISSYLLDLPSLQPLLYGYDPDSVELANQYPLSDEMFSFIAKIVAENLPPEAKTYVLLEKFSSSIIEKITNQGFTGVIVKPRVAHYAKQCIIDFEKRKK